MKQISITFQKDCADRKSYTLLKGRKKLGLTKKKKAKKKKQENWKTSQKATRWNSTRGVQC